MTYETFEQWRGFFVSAFDETWNTVVRNHNRPNYVWSKALTSKRLLEMVETAFTLKANAGAPLTFRSTMYRLWDAGVINGTFDSAIVNWNAVMTDFRDEGLIPWELFSDDAGTDMRGLLPAELEDSIAAFRRNNIAPRVIGGKLYALWIEKSGLVPFIRNVTGGIFPVGSPGGNVKKSWAYQRFIPDLLGLAAEMKAGLAIVYIGDGESGKSKGWDIRDQTREWLDRICGIPNFKNFAVTEEQVRVINRTEIHLDGYIALIGPDVFGRRLRKYLGLRTSP